MSPPPLTRTFKVQYGSLDVSTAGGYTLLGEPLINIDEDNFAIAFSVLISESSTGAAETKWTDLEAAFGADERDVILTLGGWVRTFSQAANTAFNIVAKARNVENSKHSSDRSREYRCEIEGDLPYDRTGEDAGYQGLRTLSYSVDKDGQNRRIVTIGGSYTAQPDTGSGLVTAQAQYVAQLPDLEDAILDLVDDAVDWDPIGTKTQEEKRGKVLAFTRTHIESLAAKTVSGFDVQIIEPLIQSATSRVGSQSSSRGVTAPVDVTVTYRCGVDKEETTDLVTVYSTKVRPRMLEVAANAAGLSGAAQTSVLEENPGLDLSNNRIEALMSVRIFAAGNIIYVLDASSDDINKGLEVVGVHDQNPASGYLFQRRILAIRTRTVSVLVVGDRGAALSALEALAPEVPYTPDTIGAGSPAQTGAPIPLESAPKFGASGGGWIEEGRTRPNVSRFEGLPGEDLEITQASQTIVSFYLATPIVREATSAVGIGGA